MFLLRWLEHRCRDVVSTVHACRVVDPENLTQELLDGDVGVLLAAGPASMVTMEMCVYGDV